jgi:hypothetical protein
MNAYTAPAMPQTPDQYTAFQGFTRIACGTLPEVSGKAKAAIDRDPNSALLVFSDKTAETVELDLRGGTETVIGKLSAQESAHPQTSAGPGRPKLGVVAREVTLLPRHWDWLNQQPGGASVALRRLVEEAKRTNAGKDRIRQSQDTCYRFLSTIAGDLPGFEEVTRALFAGNHKRFDALMESWPADVCGHAQKLGVAAFEESDEDKP